MGQCRVDSRATSAAAAGATAWAVDSSGRCRQGASFNEIQRLREASDGESNASASRALSSPSPPVPADSSSPEHLLTPEEEAELERQSRQVVADLEDLFA